MMIEFQPIIQENFLIMRYGAHLEKLGVLHFGILPPHVFVTLRIKVLTKNIGTIKANCNPRGRVASINCGRNAAMKTKLLGLGIVMTSP
jgi:hypothetical protein